MFKGVSELEAGAGTGHAKSLTPSVPLCQRRAPAAAAHKLSLRRVAVERAGVETFSLLGWIRRDADASW